MKKKFILLASFVLIGMIAFSFAGAATTPKVVTDGAVTTRAVCADSNMTSATGIVNWASCTIMGVIIPFLFSLAAAAFIWGVISYYLNPDNEEKRKKGKSFIIGGLIALFVMTSMWGIIRIFSGTFGVKTVIPSFDNINDTDN